MTNKNTASGIIDEMAAPELYSLDFMLQGVTISDVHQNLRTKKIAQLAAQLVRFLRSELEQPVDDETTQADLNAAHADLACRLVGEIAMKLTCANFDDKHQLMIKHMEQLFGLFTWLNEGIEQIDRGEYQDARADLDLGRHRLLDIINDLRDSENFIFNTDPMMTLAEHQQLIAEAEERASEK